MEWKTTTEQAVLGFIGYGAASLALSPSLLHFSLSSLSGALAAFGYAYLRPLPWGVYLKRFTPGATDLEKKIACVSVTSDLRFREVSTKPPTGSGFIRVQGVNKQELFQKLQNKTIDRGSLPFHMKVLLEEGRQLEIPWSAIEPHLRGI